MAAYQGIVCDGCGKKVQTPAGSDRPSLAALREQLKADGWAVLQYGGKDYCGPCCRLGLHKKSTRTV